MIITKNITEKNTLQKLLEYLKCPQNVTYYKAPDTMGIASEKRICIAIGAAHKPANAYDAITENRAESDILKEEAMHCDTWQAWSRVKDPNGEKRSVVFAFGCNEETCQNIITWGTERRVALTNRTNGFKKSIHIVCRNTLSSPKLIKLYHGDDALLVADSWFSLNFRLKKWSQNPYYLIYIRGFDSTSLNVSSDSMLLLVFSSRNDAYAIQNANGRYSKVYRNTDIGLLQSHVNGDKTIGFYCLDKDSMVSWLCFDIDSHPSADDSNVIIQEKNAHADSDVQTMCAFMDENDLPYILEASGSPHSYHVWILLKKIKAHIAKKYGEAILKETGIDCELFPKQNALGRKGFGNLVKLPFAINRKNGNKSKIFYNGEWISTVPDGGMNVGVIDISFFESHAKECKTKQKQEIRKQKRRQAVKNISGQVRPCISNALNLKLTGTQGHFMRIAIAREYSTVVGYTDQHIATLFQFQPDYDYSTSLSQVKSITSVSLPPWKCSTLQNKCSKFVDCFGCDYYK